jgi:membrane-bound lytic murein transglycosylase D
MMRFSLPKHVRHCLALTLILFLLNCNMIAAADASPKSKPKDTEPAETTDASSDEADVDEQGLVPITDPGDIDTEDLTPPEDTETTQPAAGTEGSTPNVSTQDGDIPPEQLGTVFPEAERKPLELEGVDHELTEKYRVRYLTTNGKQWLAKALADSAPYRPYIRQQLAEKNLPLILQYLPIVESNYKTSAVSRAGAVGIWQFMTNSMAPFLKKNSWYDERRDPWKATDAALVKLAENYKMFGDWEIAIAAYNCGAGAMTRVLKKNPDKDFWYLAENKQLRSQSTEYVPKLLAIADIIENAEYYGAIEVGAADKIIEDVPVEQFDFVNVAGMFSLAQISKITGIDEDMVNMLNPALFRSCTPARQTYQLRLPLGTGENAEKQLKDHGVATDALTYTVKSGDSLWGISRKFGLTVQDLCDVNNIKEKAILSIGQTLIVPIFKEEK